MRAAYASKEADGSRIIMARELVEARFAKNCNPSLAARRTLAIMIAEASGDAWTATIHRITKRSLRKGHKGNERISDILDEVAAIRLVCETVSSRGRQAISRNGLFEAMIEETFDEEGAWIEYRFNYHARQIFASSEHYADMRRDALLAFDSKYSVTLYELGCLYCCRRSPHIDIKVPDLRERLGIEEGRYGNFNNLRRCVLSQAKAEIDHLAHFNFDWTEVCQGRRIVGLGLYFWQKETEELQHVSKEFHRPRFGRKSRRMSTARKSLQLRAGLRAGIIHSLVQAKGTFEDEIPF